jgi:hypothetical protein
MDTSIPVELRKFKILRKAMPTKEIINKKKEITEEIEEKKETVIEKTKLTEEMEKISRLPLNSKWFIWLHSIKNTSWTEKDYECLDKAIETVGDLLRFYNNFNDFDFKNNHVFIMREGIKPIWEDKKNRNGGICSFKTDYFNKMFPELSSAEVFKYILLCVCGETLHSDVAKHNTINGLSLSPKIYPNTKKITCIVKIWNGEKNDLSKEIREDVLNKYEILSIRYKSNEPEY